MRKPIIEFKNFTFQYHSQQEPTLHDINLAIFPNEKVLICGLSGSGKSTLGHCLNGLIPFSYKGEITGDLLIKGQSCLNQSIFERSKNVGTILQDSDGQFVSLTVAEDIAFILENYETTQERMFEIVYEQASLVGMEEFLEASPNLLSGGQKQRVALAGVLANNVEILLFDEPLANLDPQAGQQAIDLIDQLVVQRNKTVLIIEHRLEDVLHRPVDRIVLIDDGRIVADMNPNELLSKINLPKMGIREPLYVSLFRYAQIPLDPSLNLQSIVDLDVAPLKEKLLDWAKSQPKEEPVVLNEPLLELKKISFSYDGVIPVLQDINLTIYKNDLLSIVGKNGAGKSTLSKIITGYERPDSGMMSLNGQDTRVLSMKQLGQRIGLVLQNPNQMISKTLLFDEIALGLRYQKLNEELITEKVHRVMEVCGLLPFREWPISALSYGQKKRVTIASILVLEPDILILDEPTAAQDYKHYTDIMNFLTDLNEKGQTILMITHDMHLILEYAKRCVVMAEGKIIMDDAPAVVLGNQEVIEKANLKQTSLYQLADKIGIDDKNEFVQSFINYEKRRRS